MGFSEGDPAAELSSFVTVVCHFSLWRCFALVVNISRLFSLRSGLSMYKTVRTTPMSLNLSLSFPRVGRRRLLFVADKHFPVLVYQRVDLT